MSSELFGLGRTWWAFLIIISIVTVFLGLGKISPEMWQEIVTWTFAIAGGKSAVVGAAGKFNGGSK